MKIAEERCNSSTVSMISGTAGANPSTVVASMGDAGVSGRVAGGLGGSDSTSRGNVGASRGATTDFTPKSEVHLRAQPV